MNRAAIINLAILAGNDMEEGYDPDVARQGLREVDPDYDWEPELFQMELECGYRIMGPRPLMHGYRGGVKGLDAMIAEVYVSHVMENVERGNLLFDMLSKS